jgi:hypothetical protein
MYKKGCAKIHYWWVAVACFFTEQREWPSSFPSSRNMRKIKGRHCLKKKGKMSCKFLEIEGKRWRFASFQGPKMAASRRSRDRSHTWPVKGHKGPKKMFWWSVAHWSCIPFFDLLTYIYEEGLRSSILFHHCPVAKINSVHNLYNTFLSGEHHRMQREEICSGKPNMNLMALRRTTGKSDQSLHIHTVRNTPKALERQPHV